VASQIDVEDDAKDVKAGLSFQEIIANICKSSLSFARLWWLIGRDFHCVSLISIPFNL